MGRGGGRVGGGGGARGERVGDLLAPDPAKRAEAIEEYRKGLEVRQGIAEADPANAGAQRDLAVSYMRTGEMLVRAQQRAEALAEYNKSGAILSRLAEDD